LKAWDDGYSTAISRLVLAPKQVFSINIALLPREKVQEMIEVQSSVADLNTQQTGTSNILTHQMMEQMPAPLKRDVQSPAETSCPEPFWVTTILSMFVAMSCLSWSFINGVSFLGNSHHHFTPGISPANL
jgi:hypothetical protein